MKKNSQLTNSARKKISLFFTALVVFLLVTRAAFTQTKNPFEGAWKIVEYVRPGKSSTGKDTTITDPQPGQFIFTRSYFSRMFVMEDRARPAVAPVKDPQNVTDAEKIARYEQWKPFAANAGTYEIKGATIIFHVIVAKSVNIMTRGKPNILEFRLDGPNTIWLIPTAEEAASEPRIKLARLE
ncbi:MAG TPA: lipocalin-like domain-containing protein [Chitinophagaceae bacterium]|nr:lipocalin-like domain-containing protein [Chitinophagaceae bacterium]